MLGREKSTAKALNHEETWHNLGMTGALGTKEMGTCCWDGKGIVREG